MPLVTFLSPAAALLASPFGCAQNLATRYVVHGLAASPPPGPLLGGASGPLPAPGLWNQNMHINKISR